jgi:hypothetical protein
MSIALEVKKRLNVDFNIIMGEALGLEDIM